MSHEIQSLFTCSCGEALPELCQLPDWACLRAFCCQGWSKQASPSTEDFFERIEHLPELGTAHLLCVDEHFGFPMPGGSVWVLFVPPSSSLNSLDSHPEEIPESGLVRVELLEVRSKTERIAWLSVRVLEVHRLTELISLFPPCLNPLPLPALMCLGEIYTVFNGVLAISHSDEDDGRAWVLCQRHAEVWSLLMHSYWSYHSEEIHVGHRQLTPEEAVSLGLDNSSPNPSLFTRGNVHSNSSIASRQIDEEN